MDCYHWAFKLILEWNEAALLEETVASISTEASPIRSLFPSTKSLKTFHQNECNFKFDRKDAGLRWTFYLYASSEQARKLSLSKNLLFLHEKFNSCANCNHPKWLENEVFVWRALKVLIWKKRTFTWAIIKIMVEF